MLFRSTGGTLTGTLSDTAGFIATGASQTPNGWLFEARGTAVTGGFAQYGNNIKSVQYWSVTNSIGVGSSYSATDPGDGNLAVSGKIGIGTLSPSVKLHVAGSTIVANNTSINPDSYLNQVVAGAISTGGWGVSSAIGGSGNTGHAWAIGTNSTRLYFEIGRAHV